ncbi:hypothetical protein CWM52_22230 [Raoultella sp. T31]|nr:hypothetical protein CWM52_22230 [Raoultella sp. T31]
MGRDLLLKYAGHTATFQAIERGIARSGTDFLIFTRLVPLFPYNIQNYAYGLTAIPFGSFMLISLLTTLPGLFIYTLMASELAVHCTHLVGLSNWRVPCPDVSTPFNSASKWLCTISLPMKAIA